MMGGEESRAHAGYRNLHTSTSTAGPWLDSDRSLAAVKKNLAKLDSDKELTDALVGKAGGSKNFCDEHDEGYYDTQDGWPQIEDSADGWPEWASTSQR